MDSKDLDSVRVGQELKGSMSQGILLVRTGQGLRNGILKCE